MNRQNFIYAQVVLFFILIVIGLAIFRDGLTVANMQDIIPLLMIAAIPQMIFTVRRLHDMDISGLWSFLILVPYISLLFGIYIAYKKGTPGYNQYGAPDDRSLLASALNRQ